MFAQPFFLSHDLSKKWVDTTVFFFLLCPFHEDDNNGGCEDVF